MDIDRFVSSCVDAAKEDDVQAAVKEVLTEAVSDHASVRTALGEPAKAGVEILHRSESLTILNALWTPRMNLMPHDHLMWSLIGIYSGREDNILWRRTEDSIKSAGAKALFEGDVVAFNDKTIHSVTNPLRKFTGGIHIYGGDFFDTKRSLWDPETLEEGPSDGDVIKEIFDRENEVYEMSVSGEKNEEKAV
ncbi:MAG: hypothetical protein DWQ47_07215 [Acidobacteria bacterium]|mgnify:CR=1 FL=1|nr:MAG: hypothetical protein DWQ32_15315 [Acidobacteriota bacterium]REJ99285.1 MAG: hypothetical protein DWQ38_14660 [Acidobacteriota bacterium]REK15994.1 MAG: hypothetical protein DWQ43_03025 [Acidobacteriota bacterium]REK43675.1 MAG: hypothetical protein DWQ47_07215 [Acidobacteriota bacterium]